MRPVLLFGHGLTTFIETVHARTHSLLQSEEEWQDGLII